MHHTSILLALALCAPGSAVADEPTIHVQLDGRGNAAFFADLGLGPNNPALAFDPSGNPGEKYTGSNYYVYLSDPVALALGVTFDPGNTGSVDVLIQGPGKGGAVRHAVKAFRNYDNIEIVIPQTYLNPNPLA